MYDLYNFFPYSISNSASLQPSLLSPVRGCECIRESVVQYWKLHRSLEGDSSCPCPKLRAIFAAFAPRWGQICHKYWCQKIWCSLGLTEQNWWQCDILTIYGPIDFILLYNYNLYIVICVSHIMLFHSPSLIGQYFTINKLTLTVCKSIHIRKIICWLLIDVACVYVF